MGGSGERERKREMEGGGFFLPGLLLGHIKSRRLSGTCRGRRLCVCVCRWSVCGHRDKVAPR